MELEILFPEIKLFGLMNIAPLQISKSSRRRLKKKDKIRSMKKEAGLEEAVKKGTSDWPSIPPLPLQGQNLLSVAPSPPNGSAGFDGTEMIWSPTLGNPPYQWMKCKQMMFPVQRRREGCWILSILVCGKEDSTICDLAQRGRGFSPCTVGHGALSDMEFISSLDAASCLILKILLVYLV